MSSLCGGKAEDTEKASHFPREDRRCSKEAAECVPLGGVAESYRPRFLVQWLLILTVPRNHREALNTESDAGLHLTETDLAGPGCPFPRALRGILLGSER